MTQPTTSSISVFKRKKDSDEEEEVDWSVKKFKAEKIRHCIVDENLVNDGNWHQFFDNVRIAAVDPVGATKDGKVIPRHYHILGIPKVFKRAARDMPNHALEALGINPQQRHVIQKITYNWINDAEHFDNLVKYCKKKTVLAENEHVQYESVTNKILDNIQKMKNQDKFTAQEMIQFKNMYPDAMDWKKDAIKLKLSKGYVSHLEAMEQQRIKEDKKAPLTISDLKDLMPFKSYLSFLRDIRIKVNAHPSNSGYCVIFAGKAGSYKTTTCEILARSFGHYHSWPGSQWTNPDILKYDDAARNQVETIIVEEIQWVSVPKKITLNNTMCSIKEQLSGTGLNIRLAKNKTCIDGLTLKIERFFMSFNPDENLTYEAVENLVNTKPEFKRRFYLYDMDSLIFANLFGGTKMPWLDSYKKKAAKLIASATEWEKYLDLIEAEENKKKETEDIMKNIEFYLSDEEPIQIKQEAKSPRKFKFLPSRKNLYCQQPATLVSDEIILSSDDEE